MFAKKYTNMKNNAGRHCVCEQNSVVIVRTSNAAVIIQPQTDRLVTRFMRAKQKPKTHAFTACIWLRTRKLNLIVATIDNNVVLNERRSY